MTLILSRAFDVLECSELRLLRQPNITVLAGRHEVERIPNPYPRGETDFIVLKGTKIGAAEQFWRFYQEGGLYKVNEVTIEE